MNKPKISRDFDPDIAADVGTDAAIIYENIWYWINFNRSQDNQSHFFENKWWTYNSIKGFNDLFFYLTEKQIRHCLDKLIEKDYLIKGNFNDTPYDRTLWYSLGQKGQMDLPNLANGDDKNGKCIVTDNKPNENTYIYREPIVNINTTPEPTTNSVGQTDIEDEYWATKRKRKEKKTSFSSFKQYPTPSVRSADPPPRIDFTPLTDMELWEIARELHVPPQAPRIKQKEILERREDGSWQKHWGNTMRFAIKNFIRKDIERGTQETLDELGMIALQHDHPDEIAKRNIIWEEAKKAGKL